MKQNTRKRKVSENTRKKTIERQSLIKTRAKRNIWKLCSIHSTFISIIFTQTKSKINFIFIQSKCFTNIKKTFKLCSRYLKLRVSTLYEFKSRNVLTIFESFVPVCFQVKQQKDAKRHWNGRRRVVIVVELHVHT